jgi:hypothetical protein
MSNGMNLWLDDERDPKDFSPHIDWVWVKTAKVAIAALEAGIVERISLDHDLGPEWETGNGYMVAKWIEEAAYTRRIPKLAWSIHSQNSVGAASMRMALNNADRYWNTH